ncbi:MAG: protein kinase, partial [Myxococcota bacterium]
GRTAAELLRVHRPLPLRSALDLTAQACSGLAHAHRLRVDGRSAGLVHRDLKPSNILVDRWGMAYVADFGFATTSESAGLGQSLDGQGGTPRYMSPEQLAQEAVDRRSDIWAMGLVLYELAIGEPLWDPGSRRNAQESLAQLPDKVAAAVRRAELQHKGLGPILAQCLATSRRKRYSRAEELRAQLLLLMRRAPGPSLAEWVDSNLYAGQVSIQPGDVSSGTVSDMPDAFLPRPKLLQRLDRAYREGQQIVALRGPAGVGKSRLARRWLSGRSEGHCVLVDLALCHTADDVFEATARVMGFDRSGSGHSGIREQLLAALGGEQPLSMCLDNADSALGPLTQIVRQWKAAAPLLTMVVTSRSRIKIEGCVRIEVNPLSSRMGAKLLVLRAQAVDDSLPEWQAASPELEQLSLELDGLPLALELAAAQAARATPIELLEQLRSESEPGQRTPRLGLADALSWSWRHLDAAEKMALSQLSIFPGAFDLKAAQAILHLPNLTGWPIRLLVGLHERSLLRSTEDGRFALLNSVRSFANQKLRQRGDHGPTSHRYASYFASIPFDDQGGRTAIQTLRWYLPDLELAAEIAAQNNDWELGADIVVRLAWILERTGPLDVAMAWLTRALGHLPSSGRHTGPLLRRAASVAGASGDADSAIEYAHALLSAARQRKAPRLQAAALHLLGRAHVLRGQPQTAQPLFGRALQLFESFRQTGLELDTRIQLMRLALNRDNLDEALEHLEAADVASQRSGAPESLASVDLAKADLAHWQEEYNEAATHASSAYTRYADAKDLHGCIQSQLILGIACAALGRRAEARQLFGSSSANARQLGAMDAVLAATTHLVIVDLEEGLLTQAIKRSQDAERLAVRLNSRVYRSLVRGSRGLCAMEQSRWERALKLLHGAATALAHLDPRASASFGGAAAEVLARLGRTDDALEAMQAASCRVRGAPASSDVAELEVRSLRVQFLVHGDPSPQVAALDALVSRHAPVPNSGLDLLVMDTRVMLGG